MATLTARWLVTAAEIFCVSPGATTRRPALTRVEKGALAGATAIPTCVGATAGAIGVAVGLGGAAIAAGAGLVIVVELAEGMTENSPG